MESLNLKAVKSVILKPSLRTQKVMQRKRAQTTAGKKKVSIPTCYREEILSKVQRIDSRSWGDKTGS